MSELYQSLSHSKWDCKYHVVFVPKRRRKAIFGQTRRQLGQILHGSARQKECQILEGHVMPDYVHLCIGIPPRHPVASVIGFLKGGVRLRTPGCAARSGTSRASISGPAGMSLRRSGSNWSGSANTSASKRSRMATVDISRRLTKTRFSATTKLMANRLGGGQLLSYPLRGADCPSCGALVRAD